jgi:hypothetical protein
MEEPASEDEALDDFGFGRKLDEGCSWEEEEERLSPRCRNNSLDSAFVSGLFTFCNNVLEQVSQSFHATSAVFHAHLHGIQRPPGVF